jgi:hypothetical protein
MNDAVLLGTPDDRATYIGMSEQPDLMGKTPRSFPGTPGLYSTRSPKPQFSGSPIGRCLTTQLNN